MKNDAVKLEKDLIRCKMNFEECKNRNLASECTYLAD